MTVPGAFVAERDIALFLDVDGTLLEIAARPDAVRVPPELRDTLQHAAGREGGALALISGRTIRELDRLFVPCLFPAAGQHGLERRDAQGKFMRPHIDTELLRPARERLSQLEAQHAGLLLEEKHTALAVHYRSAPQLASIVRAEMVKLARLLEGQFVLRKGKCVLELAPAGYSKRSAIEAFMTEAPFAGRFPVFVGDDVTDEDGFAAVNALGGHSIRVGNDEATVARSRLGSVSAVVAWLRERNATP
jgi:trehalose 6-phosphate phosphatase